MSDELLRALVGVPIAFLWPLGAPWVAASVARRALATGLTAAYALGPYLDDWPAWVLLGVACVAAAVPHRRSWRGRGEEDRAAAGPVSGERGDEDRVSASPVIAAGAALALAAAAAVALDADGAWEAARRVARDDEVAFVALGALAAVFVAAALITAMLGPLSRRVEKDERSAGVLHAGLYIGYLERGLVFAFLVGGEPGAAALALTAKSVARFPAFDPEKEPLAEYVLIGTLTSFTAATAVGIAVRGLLHMPAL